MPQSAGRRLADGEGDELEAFLLTLGAGLATTVGAAMAFCMPVHHHKVFAVCLGISAGVMTQVSYQEIFSKAEEEFAAEGFKDADAFALTTVIFFGGIIVSAGLEFLSHQVLGVRDHCVADPDCPEPAPEDVEQQANVVAEEDMEGEAEQSGGQEATQAQVAAVEGKPRKPEQQPDENQKQDKAEMIQMAAFSGMAIAMHNFPEGLATFVATLADPSFGATMALAIAIHNVPEGLAVAVPIVKATGSRSRAFLWAFGSGLFEPLGGLLGWLILKEVIGPITYAILFGLIGGIMVHISFKKLLPTALKHDPKNEVTSYGFFFGMAVMAGSLVAFGY